MNGRFGIFVAWSLVAAGLAGCLGGEDAGGPQGVGFDAEDAVLIEGQVLDQELVPVAGAYVGTSDGDHENTTDDEGLFRLGPVAPGDHVVVIEKDGYAVAEVPVSVPPGGPVDRLSILLTPVAADVPYHLSETFVTFVYCATYNPIGGVPCTKLIDYVAGTNVSPEERFAYPFEIQNPGLANMLIEMNWETQQFGKDMLYMIQTPPGQPLTAATVKYFAKDGPSPLRGWLTAGVANDCGGSECAGVFDATPGNITYEALTVWSGENGTIPGVPGVLSGWSFYINHRTETWHTFFHNRPGPAGFSALPDE